MLRFSTFCATKYQPLMRPTLRYVAFHIRGGRGGGILRAKKAKLFSTERQFVVLEGYMQATSGSERDMRVSKVPSR